MASPIVLTFNGETARFQHKKLDRSKLYGKRHRLPLDADGNRCEKAEITDDGELLIRTGMTAQGYFDDVGCWVPNSELVAISEDGEVLEKIESTLGVESEMTEATPEELLDLKVSSIYMLDPEEISDGFKDLLSDGSLFRFTFNYRTDYHAETAFLVCNDQGWFAIIGNPVETKWLSLDQIVDETIEEDDEDDGDLDFEMF